MRAAEHAPRGPLRLLQRRHGLADIVECGARVQPERDRVWSYDDPAECDDEPEESWLFEYKVVDQTCNPDGRTETITFRGTFLHKDGVAKDEFVLHCDTIDSPSTYTGRGESDFGEYTIVGECINGELDSAEFTFRKLV